MTNIAVARYLIRAKMCLIAAVVPVVATAADAAAEFVFLRGDAALPDEPNRIELIIESMESVAVKTHITMVTEDAADAAEDAGDVNGAAEKWTIELPADFVISQQFSVGDEITLLPLRDEQEESVLGYALIVDGDFLFYVSDKNLPLYSRQVDG